MNWTASCARTVQGKFRDKIVKFRRLGGSRRPSRSAPSRWLSSDRRLLSLGEPWDGVREDYRHPLSGHRIRPL
jgi:hypothetical protein